MRRQIIKSWEKRKMKALRPPRCTGVIYLDSFSVIGPESFTQVQKSWVNCKNSASYLPTTLNDIERNTERKSETLKQRHRQKQWHGYLVGGICSKKGPYQIMLHGTVYITWNFNFTIEVSTHILTKTTNFFLSTWVFTLSKCVLRCCILWHYLYILPQERTDLFFSFTWHFSSNTICIKASAVKLSTPPAHSKNLELMYTPVLRHPLLFNSFA